jgi:anti-sigma-K factor RskA
MKYEDRELLDQLAGEYVVGTMRGRVRRRFERICANNPQAQSAVQRWEDRLVGMLKDVRAEQPAPQVWDGIERRLKLRSTGNEQSTQSLFAWLFGHWSRAALAGVAALSIGIGVYLQTALQTESIGVFAEAQRGDIWRVNSTRDGDTLVVEAAQGVTPDAQHSYELWALPEGGAPVSLGLLPQSGRATLALNSAQQAALRGAGKIAVSLEPVGGSPTGAPTGPVLHVTEVTKLG